jgi:hypothetical protein
MADIAEVLFLFEGFTCLAKVFAAFMFSAGLNEYIT